MSDIWNKNFNNYLIYYAKLMTIGKNWFMLDAHQVFGVFPQFLMLSLNKINLAKVNVSSSTWILPQPNSLRKKK